MEEFEQEEYQDPGLVGRMIRVFTAPSETFEAVGQRSSWVDWVAPVVLVAVLSMVSMQITMPALQQIQQQAMQERLKDMPEDQRQQAMAIAQTTGAIGMMVGVPVFSFIVLFAAGGVLLLIARYGLGGEVKYGQMLAVWGYSSLIGIVALIVRTPLTLAKNTPMVYTGLGIFLPDEMLQTFFGRFLAGVDFFLLWQIGVASIGLATLSRTSTSKPLVILLILFVVWLVIQAALGGLSGMMGAGG